MLYEFTKLQLKKDEFYNLVFMNAPDKWKADLCEDNVLRQICTKPLHHVVEKVIEKSGLTGGDQRSTEIFEKIKEEAPGEHGPWFASYAHLSKRFEKREMLPISIRNLSKHSKEQCNKASRFYIEDGCRRSLVYALKVKLREKEYEPVEAIHATSWELTNGILGFIPEPAVSLVDEGKFPHNINPTEIQIKTYKR